MDFRFLDFCRHDTLFYDAPDPVADDLDFDVRPHLAAGWTVDAGARVDRVHPDGPDPPDQGWKCTCAAAPGQCGSPARHRRAVLRRAGTDVQVHQQPRDPQPPWKQVRRPYRQRQVITSTLRTTTSLERTLNELDDLVGGAPAPNILERPAVAARPAVRPVRRLQPAAGSRRQRRGWSRRSRTPTASSSPTSVGRSSGRRRG